MRSVAETEAKALRDAGAVEWQGLDVAVCDALVWSRVDFEDAVRREEKRRSGNLEPLRNGGRERLISGTAS